MDWKENEVREDLDKIRAMIEALKSKYGEDFSCILAVGCDIGGAFACETLIGGNPSMLHQACHGLLNVPKFITELIDTIICILRHNQPKNISKSSIQATELSIKSLGKVLLMGTKAYKEYMEEKQIDQDVAELVDSVFNNDNTVN